MHAAIAILAVAAPIAVQAYARQTAELQARIDSLAAAGGGTLRGNVIDAGGQWDAGMDDDAGKAAATSQGDLPGADYAGARKIYPKRDRLFTTSLDGTWAFKLERGLNTPDPIDADVVPDLIYTRHYGF